MARKRARQEEEEQATDVHSKNTPATTDAAPAAKLKKQTAATAGSNTGRGNAVTAGDDKSSDGLDDKVRADEEEREGSGSDGEDDDSDSDDVDGGCRVRLMVYDLELYCLLTVDDTLVYCAADTPHRP